MRILMVCLGNICRSPVAEGILRHKSENYKLNIQVDSAGTSNYHIGQHPDTRSAGNAAKRGVDISKLKGRQFSVQDFDNFDLIYVMDQSNYRDVLSLARNENDRQKVEMILNVSLPNSNKAVPDPYYGGENGFDLVFNLLDEACEKICMNYIELQRHGK